MKKVFLIGIFFSSFFTILFLRDVFLNITKPLGTGDISYNYFMLQNNFEKISNLNFKDLFDTRMFYPNKNTLALGNSFLPQSILGLPTYLLTKNLLIAAHSILIINSFLSFLAIYLLTYKLTKHIGGSILSGLLYSYNPYVFAQFPYHFELVTLQWIPLIFLFTEKILEKMSWLNIFALFFLLLIQLASSAYYIFFIAVSLPSYLLARIYFKKLSPKIFLNRKVAIGILAMIAGAYLYLMPYVRAQSAYSMTVSLDYVSLLSLDLSDFLFTTPTNLLYGGLTQSPLGQKIRDPYTFIHYTEHSYFPGIATLVLIIISLWFVIRRMFQEKDNQLVISLLVVALICLMLAFGPSFFPYLLLYKFVPLASGLSAPSRFMVIGLMALFIVCSFTLKYLKLNVTVISLIIFLITLEFWQKPLASLEIDHQIKEFYSWLEGQSAVTVIVEIPMANGFPEQVNNGRDFMADSQYLLYGISHHKKMVNGYNAFIPPDAIFLGISLMNFPSTSSLSKLKNLGVDAIILHSDEYPNPFQGEQVMQRLEKLGLKSIYTSELINAFSL